MPARLSIPAPALFLIGCFLIMTRVEAADPIRLPDAASGKALNAVWFTDAKHGWIVGEGGLCLASSDGGTTWKVRATGSGAVLRDVRFFPDRLHGFACGDSDPAAPACTAGHVMFGDGIKNLCGTLLATEDGGTTWSCSWVMSAFLLPSVEINGYPLLQLGVCGGHGHIDGDILRSSDGGKSFQGERSYRGLNDIRAIDDKRWVAVGSPVMVGFTPTPQSPLYLQHACRALFSSDGGASWSPSTGSDGDAILHRAAAKPGAPVVAVGAGGTILISDDAGQSWRASASGTQADLAGVAYAAGKQKSAMAVGAKGAVLVTGDRGATWTTVPDEATSDLHGVCALGTGFIAVGDGGTVLRFSAKDLAAPGR